MNPETESSMVQSVRDANREHLKKLWRDNRYKASIVKRGGLDQLQSRTYSPTDVHSMATKLRKKKSVDRTFLTELSQALALSEQNTSAFKSVDGSLNALCSFLTGN